MAFLTAGQNITLSAATSGSYASYERGKTNDPSGSIGQEEGATFMLKYTGGDETKVTIKAYYKDAGYTTDATQYFGIYENSSGTLQQWSRDITTPAGAAIIYVSVSIPFPKNSSTVAITITATGGTPTGVIVVGLKRDNAAG